MWRTWALEMLPLLKAQSYARGLSSCQKKHIFLLQQEKMKKVFLHVSSHQQTALFRNE